MTFNPWIVGAAWLLCSVLSAGFTYAYFAKHKAGYTSHRKILGFALAFSISGPIALLISFLYSGFGQSGWRLWPKESK
jgi:hypothetical protein